MVANTNNTHTPPRASRPFPLELKRRIICTEIEYAAERGRIGAEDEGFSLFLEGLTGTRLIEQLAALGYTVRPLTPIEPDGLCRNVTIGNGIIVNLATGLFYQL